jgi:hypothetical protein
MGDAYYNNVVYSSIASWAAQLRYTRKLYKHIRGIYNPVARLVELYVSKVYGGRLDMTTLTAGAIPIETGNEDVRPAIAQLWAWSNWDRAKNLYVRHGAKFGDVALKVVDDRLRSQVRLEVLHPALIKDITTDAIGNILRIVIEYEAKEEVEAPVYNTEPEPRTYVYTEVITPTSFETYKNGEPFAYYTDAKGKPTAAWDNEYGFVPVVLCQHRDLGLGWGAAAYMDAMRKIDELNDAASLLNDQMRKAVTPIWYFAGIKRAEEVAVGTDDKDALPAIYGPQDSAVQPMIADVDLASGLSNLQAMLAEIERDMPELALHRIRETGNLTAPGVRAAYSDAIDRIVEARGNYDAALVRAQSMALAIGGHNGYDGFQGFSLADYLNGQLDHSIGDRPIVQDELTRLDLVQLLLQSQAPLDAVWEVLGVPEDKRVQWMREAEERAARFESRLDIDDETRTSYVGQAGEPTDTGEEMA